MTLRGRLIALFPLLILSLCVAAASFAISQQRAVWLLLLPVILYLLPPFCFRLHQILAPLREGLHSLDTPGYSPWWGSLQLQNIYNAMPALEAILRIIPGCYSAWLRLWGSKIGGGVVWTPQVEISDRSLLEIGDRVVFGHKVALFAHVVDKRPKRGFRLFLNRIRIGDDVFLGAGSRLGPGADIADGTRLPILTDVYVNEKRESENGDP
jgi:hypothetical protein